MVYGIVAAALFCLTVKGYCGKKTSCFVKDTGDAFLFNLLRMLLCILIGAAFLFTENGQISLYIESKMLWICVLSGVSNAAFLAGWLLAVQKNAMVSVDVSLTLGSLIPSILCAILFAEPISFLKMLGFGLILIATVILAGHSKKTVGGGLVGILLLIFTAVGDGLSGVAQQLYKQYYTEIGTKTHGVFYPKTLFHFYTYVFAAIAFLILLIGFRLAAKKSSPEKKEFSFKIPPHVAIHILIMAIALFAANYLQTMATNDFGMPSQVLYPVIKGGCLITVNFTAMLFFGEKITLRSVCGSLLALGGIISMSIL